MKRQSLELLALYNDQSSKNTSTLKPEPSHPSMNWKKKTKKMAIHHKTLDTTTDSSSLDALFCEEAEPTWEEDEDDNEAFTVGQESFSRPTLKPLFLVDEDASLVPTILDEELHRLFSKEQQDTTNLKESVSSVSTEAVKWMLTAVADHSFSPATAVVAVNYLERFLSSFDIGLQRDNKPWMIQLVAVTCLSLAAKVEETHVPLLLDLQVGDVKYLFEAKTIQRMELLVLSTLKWKMHPVTPLSFIYHIINRLGFNTHYVYWDFLTRCENLLLAAISDSRCMGCLPSVLASATMMNVLDEVQSYGSIEYNNHLLRVLRTTKEKVDFWYQIIHEIGCSTTNKRKFGGNYSPESPVTVIDSFFSSGDISDDMSYSDGYRHLSFKRTKLP